MRIFKFSLSLFLFLISCESEKNKKLLEDSIYIYDSTNDVYDNTINKDYILDKDSIEPQFVNNLKGQLKLDSIKPERKIKVTKRKTKILSSNLIIDGEFIYFFDANSNFIKQNLNQKSDKSKIDLGKDKKGFSSLKKHISFNDSRITATIGNNNVYYIDSEKFSQIWQKELSSTIRASNLIDNKNIFLSTIDNVIFALNKIDGSVKWKSEFDSKQTSIYGSGFLKLFKDNLIFTTSLGETISLNKNNGQTIWNDKTNISNIYVSEYDMFDSENKPIIDNYNFYTWTFSGYVISYDLISGIRQWSLNIRPITNLWLNGSLLYTVTNDAKIVAIDKNYGKIAWVKPLSDYNKIDAEIFNEKNISSIFVLNNKLAILSKSGRLLYVDPLTGNYLSNRRFVKNIISLPYIFEERLYLQDHFGNIIIYK